MKQRRKVIRSQNQIPWKIRLIEWVETLFFLVFAVLLLLFILYILKSFMGIDLFPDFSLGIWDWLTGKK
ncbi:MAG: hypothetical protein J0L62_10885 [Bacteroidetes bacterium]|nr:hypothetical protein [Bacteroidota bacterium]